MSCKKDTAPQGILSKSQMVDWMLSMYLAEAKAQMLPYSRDSAYKLFLPFQDTLMHRKGIQDSVLRRTYQYYAENPIEMEALYDIIIDSLSLREQRLLPGARPQP
jgi:Domain of unknown function (DUF4296)